MLRASLLHTLQALWPDFRWTLTQVGIERGCTCSVPPYEITVEFLAGYTNITVIREYGENARVSVVGASAGTTEESIRRAFLEAQVAWMLLQAFPKRPKAAVLEEPPLDSDFLARLARAALEEQS
jgi:hypothetical protein